MRKRSHSIQIKLHNQAPVPIQLINNTLNEDSLEIDSNQDQSTIETSSITSHSNNEDPNMEHIKSPILSPPMSPNMSRSWATNVRIGDCSIVRGTVSSYKYVVWTIKIDTIQGTTTTVYKRYSDFEKLRELLVKYYPKEVGADRSENRNRSNSIESALFSGSSSGEYVGSYENDNVEIAKLPGKRIFGDNLDVKFLKKRRNGLEYFLSSVLLNPKFCNTGIVKEWLLQ